jgi:hypothetical protein
VCRGLRWQRTPQRRLIPVERDVRVLGSGAGAPSVVDGGYSPGDGVYGQDRSVLAGRHARVPRAIGEGLGSGWIASEKCGTFSRRKDQEHDARVRRVHPGGARAGVQVGPRDGSRGARFWRSPFPMCTVKHHCAACSQTWGTSLRQMWAALRCGVAGMMAICQDIEGS